MGLIIGFTMAFGLLQYISYVIELKTYGSVELTTFYSLTHPQIAETTNIVGALYSVVNAGFDWIKTLLDMLLFNFAFFDGWLLIVKYLIFIPVSVGLVWQIISFLRGSDGQ